MDLISLKNLDRDVLREVLRITNVAVVIVDSDLRLLAYTPAVGYVLKVVPSDLGKHIDEIKDHISAVDLDKWIIEAINTHNIITRDILHPNGRWYSLQIAPYTVGFQFGEGVAIVFNDIDERKHSEQLVQESLHYAEGIVETVREPLVVLDENLRVQTANRSFYQTFHVPPEETEGKLVYELGDGQWDIPQLRTLLEDILPRSAQFSDFEVEHDFPSIGRKIMLLNARRFVLQDDHSQLILLAIEDITERKAAQAALLTAFEREHRIADVLQRSLVADITLDLECCGISARYRPALAEAEVGGDFYDVFDLGGSKIALVVGDVSGKGLDAAVYTAMAKYMLRAFAQGNPHSAQVLEKLNEALYYYIPDNMFITILFGILDTSALTFTCANAGHEPPLLYRHKTKTASAIDVFGAVISLGKDSSYTEVETELSSGDTLHIYTDGITEARDQGKFFGVGGLEKTLAANSELDGDALIEAVFDAALKAGLGRLRDDAAILVVKVK